MIYHLAGELTAWFIQQGLLQQKDYEMYVYCIDRLFGQIFFYVTLFAVAGYLQILPQTIWYYIGFNVFRYTAGGYHAKSNKDCIILTWIVYAISMLVVYYVTPFLIGTTVGSIICIVSSTLIAKKYAPIDHFNKPVSLERKLQMHRYCLFFQAIFVFIVLFLLVLHMATYALCLALGNGLAALFLLYANYIY